MLPIAALIVTDGADAWVDGVDPAERAALAANRAGVPYVYFTGPRQPDLALLQRLRARGVFAGDLLGWPRLFAGLPAARQVVVIEAGATNHPSCVASLVAEAAAEPESAMLAVAVGPARKPNLIDVDHGVVASVMGGGNAVSRGLLVVPAALLGKLATVRSMTDAVHRLAKTGQLRAMVMAVPEPARRSVGQEFAARLRRWAQSYSMVTAR